MPCPITSPIRGHRPVTRSMRHRIEGQSEGEMRFFTPELYLRYNSPDDAEADRAEKDWETAIRDYKKHLHALSKDMSDRVRDLAETLCLHDAELLSLQEDLPEPPLPLLTP